jgi:voltage-gated potassium channel
MENNWRKQIFDVVEVNGTSAWSKIYNWAMLCVIVLSIVPLTSREQTGFFKWIDIFSVSIFIIDYALRWMTADFKMPDRPKQQAFICYPFTAFAIIDLLSILPSFLMISRALKVLRVTRLMKILRVFKFIRYSENVRLLFKVLRKERRILFTVFLFALFYIVVTALIMFNIEESAMFENFLDALYWATTTLTTVGYGDICPTTDVGRVISMLSAILGVAVIALPSGVITARYLEELRELKENATDEEEK